MSTPDRMYLALAGEAQGCRDIWLAEDLFHRGAMATAGALLSSMSKARIGLGVVTPQVRQAALVAMELRTLNELADGRVMLGVGAGVKARVEAMGLTFERPSSGMVEYVAAVREWYAAGDDTESPTPIPAFLAAIGEKSMERAAVSADGVLLSMMASSTHVEWAASIMSKAGNGGQVVANIPMFTDSYGSQSRRRAQEFVASYMTRWAAMPALAQLFTVWGVLDDGEFQGIVAELAAGRPAKEAVPIEAALGHSVAGSPTDCRSQLRRYAAAGLTTAAFDPGEPSRSAADMLAKAIAEVYG